MPQLSQLSLIDLVVIVAVLGTVLGALRRRAGLLAALAGGLGAGLVCWIAGAAVLLWAPPALAHQVSSSYLFSLVAPPTRALQQAGQLVNGLVTSLTATSTTYLEGHH